MLLRIAISTAVVSCLVLIGWKFVSMRRDIPFQEIIPLDRSISIVNAGNWYVDKIKLKLYLQNTPLQEGSYNDKGICIFTDLSYQKIYTLELKRSDLKGLLLYKKLIKIVCPAKEEVQYVILVGASVGKAWEFPSIPERQHWKEEKIVLGNRTIYDFDKGSAIQSLIELPIPVSAVIIKECAAFFPRDVNSSQASINRWVSQLLSRHIKPILATVVPVTKIHDFSHPGRFQSIIEFNKFIREYASSKGIAVLDLEKALRISDDDHHLREEYAAADGLHLVKKGYDVLDEIVLSVIKKQLN